MGESETLRSTKGKPVNVDHNQNNEDIGELKVIKSNQDLKVGAKRI